MFLLDSTFDELIRTIGEPNGLNPAKGDPVFYFVYEPDQMLTVKKRYTRWTAKLEGSGHRVKRVSVSDIMWDIVDRSGRWDEWLELEDQADVEDINESIRDVLRSNDALVERIVSEVVGVPAGTVVFITETELLHPYFRTRVIEHYMHDKVSAPTVIFYPGRRIGQYGLRFLGIHKEDGNYRSSLLGGL